MAGSTERIAVRLDGQTGIKEIARFFGPSRQRMFGVTHLPSEDPLAGLVICSPVHAEFVQNYRREVNLGRRLAARGVAVQRFHYRGCGNSEGDAENLTRETMRADSLTATEEFTRLVGMSRLVFLGTRLGGLIAASLASTFDGAPIALWEPVLDVDQYVREIERYRLIHQVKGENPAALGQERIAERLRLKSSAEVLGYSLSRSLYASFAGSALTSELGSNPRSILLLQMGGSRKLRPDYEDSLRILRNRNFRVQADSVGDQQAWWFITHSNTDGPQKSQGLVERTVEWLDAISRGEEA